MLFNSYIFILFFLPLCLVVYFLLNKFKLYKTGLVFLTGMSLWFYGFSNPSYLPVICGSIIVNYLIYFFMSKMSERKNKKILMILGVVFNLGLLGYFKYVDFFIENVNAMFKQDMRLLKIALPLGISFFTFQQISFVIDAYKGEVGKCNFLEYASFVSYFPQLVAGPIVSHDEILPQLRDQSKKLPSWKNLSMGFYVFTLGLAKKMLIADTFGKMVDEGYITVINVMNYGGQSINTVEAVLICLAYAFQLYFDFSGYCDMAIGIAKMMNIELPLNFDSPYKSANAGEFWKRWHMTLNRFLTKYVYIPLGGSRKGIAITCINTLLVFFMSGLWHGASWGFVIWGLINGLCVVLYRLCRKVIDKIPHAITCLCTFLMYAFSLIFFRAEKVSVAIAFIKRMFSFEFGTINPKLYEGFEFPEFEKVFSVLPVEKYAAMICLVIFFVLAFVMVFFCKNSVQQMKQMEERKPKIFNAVLLAVLFVWCIVSLGEVSTFLYFNF